MAVNAPLTPPEPLEGMAVTRLDGAHDVQSLGHDTFETLPTG